MKIRSTSIALSLSQRFDEFCNFSEVILRKFPDSVDEFLPFHGWAGAADPATMYWLAVSDSRAVDAPGIIVFAIGPCGGAG